MTKVRQRRKATPRKPRSECSCCTKRSYESSNFSSLESASEPSKHSSINESVKESQSYKRIRSGLRRSVPAALVMWAFHKLPSERGLSSSRIINFLKKHYRANDNPRKAGKSIGALLRCAVEFGLIEKRGNKYYLVQSEPESESDESMSA